MDTRGYGEIGAGRAGAGVLRAHRLAWEFAYGPIPTGAQVLHRCDNPPCCNPSHLFLGTHQDNMADKVAKGRQTGPKGERHPRALITDADVVAIREAHARGATNVALGRQYGIAPNSVSSIVHRVTWGHVP